MNGVNGIKVFLVLSVLAIFVWSIRNRHRVGLRASARLVTAAVALLAVISVIQPDITQWAAEEVGVTRGTDLVLYVSLVVFAALAVAQHLRARDLEERFVMLVSQLALREAGSPRGEADADPDDLV